LGRKPGYWFSAVVSLGISVDIDFGEILDYLITDPKTHSILMYIEGVRDARAFMSGLRAAARVKPVVVVKAGRHEASVKATVSHTGAMVGADDVFDAALRRAGVVRGMHVGDLFSAATVLSHGLRAKGERLAIVTNGGGPAAMACDKASDLDIPLAELSESTLAELNNQLPSMWSHGNPIDILGDATADTYEKVTQTILGDANIDGVVLLLTPQAMTDPLAVAERVVALNSTATKPIVTCWMGEKQVKSARKLFTDHGIPTYRLPENAVQGFGFLTNFYRNQKLLLQIPGPLSEAQAPDTEGAQLIIDSVLAEKRSVLTEIESKAILAAFHIPIASAVVANSITDAIVVAENIGFPVAMKIYSKTITHKSDIGGVRLNITNAAAVQTAFRELLESVAENSPDAHVDGVVIEPMIKCANGRELLVGITRDPVFGPVITFGTGGTAVELIADRSVSLPPLNRLLAADMISRTRVAKMLDAHRDKPAAAIRDVENVLLRISEIACELPSVLELDINPLIADERGVIAVDARIVVGHYYNSQRNYSHTAIHPYPAHLSEEAMLTGGVRCKIRPIRPEDAELERTFVEGLSDTSKHYRFMNTFRQIPADMLAKFTQIDYDREMAFIAVVTERGIEKEIGVSRYVINADADSCEFAIVVTDAWHGKGVAHRLMEAIIGCARTRGLRYMMGDVLADNLQMIQLAKNWVLLLNKVEMIQPR
jgi:Acyl-CoA synthetase (NDP forming)